MQATATLSKLEQHGAHAVLTTGLSVILGLLLSLIVARTLGPSGKGILDLASATAALFILVLGMSFNAAITHHLARRGERPAGLVGQLALLGAAAAGCTTICLAVRPDLAMQAGLLPGEDPRFWISFIAATVWLGIWAAGIRAIVIGQHAIIAANRIDVTVKAALLLGYVTIALNASGSPRPFALAGIVAAALLTGALLLAVRGPTVPASGTWPALLAIALPVHGTNILHFLNQRADLFFIQAFHGPAEVGLYALAVSLAQCILMLSSALAQPLLPQISAAVSAEAAASATAQTCRTFVALGLLAAAGLALVAPWLVPLLFGRDFSGSIASLLVLLPGMLGFGLTNILISHFVGVGRSRVNLWIAVAVMLATIAGNMTLTRHAGAIGAAATSTAAYLLAGALSWWVFRRANRQLPLTGIWPRPGDWHRAMIVVGRFRL